jgi:MFS family permease
MLVFPAVLLPLTGRLDMEMANVLDLSFWMYLLFGLSALPWGILADRLGPKLLLGLFYAGAGCCALWAAAVIDQPGQFSLALAGVGLFSGIYHPAGLGWIAKSVSRTSVGMAYNGMFGNLGLALGPLIAGLVNYYSGVENVYIIMGVLNFAGLLLLVQAKAAGTGSSTAKLTLYIQLNADSFNLEFL